MAGEDPLSWDDATLARLAASRGGAAWEELLRRVGPACEGCMREVFRRAGVPDPAAEAAEAMGSLAEALLARDAAALRAYRPPTPLKAYLVAVARHLSFRVLKKRHPALPLEAAGRELAWVQADPAVDVQRVHLALGRLRPRERLLLQLVYWRGLTYEETARVAGIEPSSLGPLLTRARESLKAFLE